MAAQAAAATMIGGATTTATGIMVKMRTMISAMTGESIAVGTNIIGVTAKNTTAKIMTTITTIGTELAPEAALHDTFC